MARPAEVGLRRRVDPISVVAEKDAVEVEFQHLVLDLIFAFEPVGRDHGFLELAVQGLLAA